MFDKKKAIGEIGMGKGYYEPLDKDGKIKFCQPVKDPHMINHKAKRIKLVLNH